MSEERTEKILEVSIKTKTNYGKKRTIHLTDFANEDVTMLISSNYNNKNERKYRISITIDCDDYSYQI